jgi:hypothetical protein
MSMLCAVGLHTSSYGVSATGSNVPMYPMEAVRRDQQIGDIMPAWDQAVSIQYQPLNIRLRRKAALVDDRREHIDFGF